MIAINWFEVFLSTQKLIVPVKNISQDGMPPPVTKKTLYSHFKIDRHQEKIYFLTFNYPEDTTLEEISLSEHRSLVETSIEHGFAIGLSKASFSVHLERVGGKGFIETNKSLRPAIYNTLEGIKFRSFSIWGEDKIIRWGLILNYETSQRFALSLDNEKFRKFALGKQIVTYDDENHNSGIFEGVTDGYGILIDDNGERKRINLREWTLPCNKQNLLSYISQFDSPITANQVSTKLSEHSLALTPERRINTSLAKDQLLKVQKLMNEFSLHNFQLLLPDSVSAKVSQDPLVVEN